MEKVTLRQAPRIWIEEEAVSIPIKVHNFIFAYGPWLGGSVGGRKLVLLFLKTLLSLIVLCAGYLSYVCDTCLMYLILVSCV